MYRCLQNPEGGIRSRTKVATTEPSFQLPFLLLPSSLAVTGIQVTLEVLLPRPPEGWNCEHMPSHLAGLYMTVHIQHGETDTLQGY